ncbi:hypothetical protein GCM10018954_003520 [Kutzneria kofuensis]
MTIRLSVRDDRAVAEADDLDAVLGPAEEGIDESVAEQVGGGEKCGKGAAGILDAKRPGR